MAVHALAQFAGQEKCSVRHCFGTENISAGLKKKFSSLRLLEKFCIHGTGTDDIYPDPRSCPAQFIAQGLRKTDYSCFAGGISSAAGKTAQCGAEGDRQRNSQAKVPMPDETPKTGGNAGPKKQPVVRRGRGESFR